MSLLVLLRCLSKRLSIGISIVFFSSTIAFTSEIFVLHVSPPENEITAGITYEKGEFIFVPEGTTAVLMDEDSNRYIVEGLEAVAADRDALAPFRLESQKLKFLTIRDFLFGKKETVIGGSRDILKQQNQSGANHPAWRLHSDLLAKYIPGERFCLVGDKLIVKRLDRSAVDFVQLTDNGTERTRQWDAGTSELAFDSFEIKADDIRKVSLKTRDHEAQVEVLGVPASILDQPKLTAAAFLARRDCTIQALMVSD